MAIFDEEARAYDTWYTTKMGAFVDQVQTNLAFDLLEVPGEMTVLEVGSGTGNFTKKLVERGCMVTGIDVSSEMLDVAREKLGDAYPDVELHQMDVTDLKFPDNTFDAVFSIVTFEFVKDIEQALDELFRVVKEGGQIVIGMISGASEWSELYQSDLFQDSVYQYADFKTLEEVKAWRPDQLADYGEALFVSPVAEEDAFTTDNEKKLAGTKNGGFLCAKWIK